MRVHMRHIRQAKLCSNGVRAWWAQHNLDWTAFLADGIDAEVLLETGDPFAERVVQIARDEHVE